MQRADCGQKITVGHESVFQAGWLKGINFSPQKLEPNIRKRLFKAIETMC